MIINLNQKDSYLAADEIMQILLKLKDNQYHYVIREGFKVWGCFNGVYAYGESKGEVKRTIKFKMK